MAAMGGTNEIRLVTTGTRGDAAPFIAYARQLMDAGQAVVLLSNADHAALAARHGVPFEAVCAPDWPQYGRDEAAFFEQVVMPGYRAVFDSIAVAPVTARIIARTGNWGAQFAAERLGLPFSRIALQPCAIRREGHPVSRREIELLNGFRADIGLPLLDDSGAVPETWQDTVCFFPKWFGMPQSDWRESGRCAGFVYLDDARYRPDAELETFLAAKPPVVVSLGSGMQHVHPFLEAAEATAERLGLPVLLLSGFTDGWSPPPDILVRPHADHGYLLPRARLILHNGGIGTVAQAIRARIPQIVVPLMWDQPDNAARVQKLGLGVHVSPCDDMADKLVAVISCLLAAVEPS